MRTALSADSRRRALRSLQAQEGGRIRGNKLYPIARALAADEPEAEVPQVDWGLGWYAVHTKPLGEFTAEEALREKGYSTFLPTFTRTIVGERRTRVRKLALFPRYVFVGFNPQLQSWGPINTADGVSRLLVDNDVPLQIPDRLISVIMVADLLKSYDDFGPVSETVRKKAVHRDRSWRGRRERARLREQRKRSRGLQDWLDQAQRGN